MLLIGVALGGVSMWLLLRAKIGAVYDRGRSESATETAALSHSGPGRTFPYPSAWG